MIDLYDQLISDPKEMHKIVTERSNGLCELCGSHYIVQRHHIVGGQGKRKQHENQYSLIDLCYYHHYGEYGVHESNGDLERKLKIRLQEQYHDLGFNEDQIRELMGGRYYIEK